LIFYKTLTNIRKKHGFTQEEFAKMLGCTEEYIVALENNKEQASFPFVVNLKDKLNLHSAPITESEREALMDSLQTFKILIDYGEMEKAAEQLPRLAKDVRASYSPSANNFFDLFAAAYYWVTDDKKAYEETMTALSKRTDEFNGKHLYYYHRLIAAREFRAYRYREALKAFMTAEKLDKDALLSNVGFYYGYGACLSDMGYVAKAIECMRKAQHMAKWRMVYNGKPNRRHDAYIDGYLARGLSKIGKTDEALGLLDNRLARELKNNNKEKIGYIYNCLGVVYLREDNYNSALNNLDMAFQYFDVGSRGYISTLYHKARALIKSGRIDEGISFVDKGLCITHDVWKALLDALRHSVSLSDPKSLSYMEKIAFANLKVYGQYDEVLEYCELISSFYNKSGKPEVALNFISLAYELQKQLYRELVEGGL